MEFPAVLGVFLNEDFTRLGLSVCFVTIREFSVDGGFVCIS